jgi:hypothetical protein
MPGQDGSASDGGSSSLATNYVKRNLGGQFDAVSCSHEIGALSSAAAMPAGPSAAAAMLSSCDSYRSSDSMETLAWGGDPPADHSDPSSSSWENSSRKWFGSYNTADCCVLSKPRHC